MNLPKRKLPIEIKSEAGIKIPIRKSSARVIPDGFEVMQPNTLFDAPPSDCFHYWRDLETGKYACHILRKKTC